jgi:Zn-dependent M28 family amino/carboxypeptidase
MDHDDAVDAALGRAWRDDRPWTFLTALTSIGDRLAGHAGEREAAGLVADAFADAGVRDVTTETFPVTTWTRGDASLELTAPVERAFETIALPYSPAGEVSGPLVDVGYGTPDEIESADLEGAIALASTTTPPGQRFVHRMESFGLAHDAGAAAFVFANHVPGQLPPTGSLRFDREAEMPGVGVSAETGDWLGEYARRAPAAETDRRRGATDGQGTGEAALRVDAETAPGESVNVHGVLGPADADDEVVLLAHVDAHDVAEGAMDNGCGIAVVVTAARILAAMDLDCRVRVAGVGSEEVGLVGASALAADLDPDSVRAAVNVDGAGRHRDLVAMTHASDAAADAARAVRDATGHPVAVDEDPHPYSDHWPFLRRGVPSLQLHSESGERGRGWGHTAADTRDKVDARNLREHAMLVALLVRELAASDPDRVDDDALHEAMLAREFEPGMRAADIWPATWE